jgi:germination protein M
MRLKKTFVMLLLLCLVPALAGCANIRSYIASRTGSEETADNTKQGYSIYYINEEETRLTPVSYRLESTTEEGIIEEMLGILADQPDQEGLKPVIAPPVNLIQYEYDKAGKTLSLYFDAEYNTLTRTTQILIRAALVKSLSQFSGIIDYVSFNIDGSWLADESGTPLLMKNEDFVVSLSGRDAYLSEATVDLYFASPDGTELKLLTTPLRYDAGSTLAAAVLDALIRGPVTGEYQTVLSANTHVNTIYIKDGLCQVDFNRGFLEKVREQSFALNVYSVVNSLTDLDEISQVYITVDGETITDAPDGIVLDDVLLPQDMVSETEIQTETSPAETDLPARSVPETKAPESKMEETAPPATEQKGK